MRFKVGDKVRAKGSGVEHWIKSIHGEKKPSYALLDEPGWFEEDEIEPVEKYKTDAEIMQELIEGRNNKSTKEINEENLLNTIQPDHYRINGKDLFDELYERLYHSEKMFTGREVFIIVMKFVAERYIRRYPNKNPEDLSKGIYTLTRLEEYEEGKDGVERTT